MSFRVIKAAADAERTDAFHEARLLLLLNRASERGDGVVDGITKLAKLDFLLRYPVYLERLLQATRRRPPDVEMLPFERDTVESKMIRFRYGPWDHRYRRWIGLLVAKGLADTFVRGRTVCVRLTERGKQVAAQVAQIEQFADLDRRSTVVASTAGRMTGTRLKDLIYRVVPELTGMSWGEEIPT